MHFFQVWTIAFINMDINTVINIIEKMQQVFKVF